MIAVIDYKMINLGSILNMLKKAGARDVVVASAPEQVTGASKIIMPGIGAFDNAISNLHQQGLVEVLREKALSEKVPFLGVCLGMQLMTNKSEEGVLPGLGFVDAEVKRFSFAEGQGLRVPHMGWNKVYVKKTSPIFNDADPRRFYFVHSYYVTCAHQNDVLGTTEFGGEFVSAFQHENLIGMQYHPEKSHSFGLEVFKNFVEKF